MAQVSVPARAKAEAIVLVDQRVQVAAIRGEAPGAAAQDIDRPVCRSCLSADRQAGVKMKRYPRKLQKKTRRCQKKPILSFLEALRL